MIRKILHQFGWFYFLRYSGLFSWYDHFFKKDIVNQQKKELAFYSSFLAPCDLIFDIGAHMGHKTQVFKKLAKRVLSVDPDRRNIMILKNRFLFSRSVTVEKLAVSDMNGESQFFLHHPGSAFNTINREWIDILEQDKQTRWNETIKFSSEVQKVRTVTLDSLINRFGKPGFIKIDVEGSELAVLKGLSQRVSCLSFEVLLPEFREETAECIRIITEMDKNAIFNFAIDEVLQLEEFLPFEKFNEEFHELSIPHLEIIAKMPASQQV